MTNYVCMYVCVCYIVYVDTTLASTGFRVTIAWRGTKSWANWYGRNRRCLRRTNMLPYKNAFSNWKIQHEIQRAIGSPINLVAEFQNCCHQQWTAGKPEDYLRPTKKRFASNSNSSSIKLSLFVCGQIFQNETIVFRKTFCKRIFFRKKWFNLESVIVTTVV